MKKITISLLIVFGIFGVISIMGIVIAGMPSQMYGNHVIFNLSEGHGYFGRLNVGGSHILDLDDEFHVFGDSHLLGNLNLTGSLSVPEIANPFGNLKIMPDVQGDVILFGDTDVGDAISGERFYVYRRAIEGDDWVSIHISASQKATIYSTANLIMQSDDGKYTQFVSGSHVYFDLDDNDGTNEIRIRDLGNNEVATIDSNGNAWFEGNILVNGTVDGRNIVTDGTKLDGISTGAEVSTKEFFLPAGSGILDNNAVFTDDAIVLPDGVAFARAYFNFHLPSDFSSMASGYPKVVMMPGTGGGGNVRIAFNSQSGGVGEQLGSSIDNIAEYTKAVSSTSNIIIEEDISNAFDGLSLSAGDSVSFYIQRDSDDAGDTFSGGLDIVGVIIKYD